MNNFILGLDIGSFEIRATIVKLEGKSISVCGTGKAKTAGIKKGVITNIEQASNSIKKAVNEATKTSGTRIDRVIVSISGAYTKYTKSSGVINVPTNEIGISEIKRAMQMAEHNANIPSDYAKLHVLPYNFKVDEQDYIEDPLGMSGSRLEVFVHIVTIANSSIKNLEKSVQMAGIEIDNIVLSGYASAISTLTKEEKELGVSVIDMGSATCDMVVHIGNSLVHNDVLLIGSNNITNDLSKALHTPLINAEALKVNYAELIKNNFKAVKLPTIGNDKSEVEIDLEIITNIIYARIEETLMLLAKKLEDSKYLDKLGAGIVLTGGMAKLDDIRDLTAAIFGDIPVRIAKPKVGGVMYEISQDPANACSIGLCLYGCGEFTPYEIDSKGELRYKDETIKPGKFHSNISHENEIATNINEIILKNEDKDSIKQNKDNIFKKIWNKITESF